MANEVFGWKVHFDTEQISVTTNPNFTSTRISDDDIRKFLNELVDKYRGIDDVAEIPANFIFNMKVICVNLNGDSYCESISPIDFWPVPPLEMFPENKSLFRR